MRPAMSLWIKILVAVVVFAAAIHVAIIVFAPYIILRGDMTTERVRTS